MICLMVRMKTTACLDMNIFKKYYGALTLQDFYPPICGKVVRFIKKRLQVPVPGLCGNNYFLHPLIIEQASKLNSSAQYCEDLILDVLLGFKDEGFYIDIGANDSSIFSNTERFYKRGWTGINIEPDPVSFEKFKEKRAKDINLNIGIGISRKELDFYRLSADTLSTFSKNAVKKYIKDGHKVLDVLKIPVKPLNDIFEEYAGGREVDFMSVDVEGFEIEVLKSNDWKKYRPKIIILEINQNQNKLLVYLSACQYKIVFNNQTNAIFIDLNYERLIAKIGTNVN